MGGDTSHSGSIRPAQMKHTRMLPGTPYPESAFIFSVVVTHTTHSPPFADDLGYRHSLLQGYILPYIHTPHTTHTHTHITHHTHHPHTTYTHHHPHITHTSHHLHTLLMRRPQKRRLTTDGAAPEPAELPSMSSQCTRSSTTRRNSCASCIATGRHS